MNTTNEKVLKVLELQGQGVSIDEIIKKMGYKDQKSLSRLMNKHNYSCKKGIFTPKETPQSVENTGLERIELQIAKLSKSMLEIQEMVKISTDKKELRIEPRELELKQTSIRVDKEVSNKFDDFCDKYGNVSKAYLYTLALEEFMEKYL